MHKYFKFITIGIEILIILLFVILRFVFNVYVIASSSMDPVLKVGDVIVSKKYNGNINNLHQGDLITYLGSVGSYNDKLITHEIVNIDVKNDCVYTKGINNNVVDPVISNDDIKAIYLYKSNFFTFLYKFYNKTIGRIIIMSLLIVSLCYYVFIFIRQIKRKDI